MNYIAKVTRTRNNGAEKDVYFAGKGYDTFRKLNYSNILCRSWNNLYIAKKAIHSHVNMVDSFWDEKEVEILSYEKVENENGSLSYHLASSEVVYKYTKVEEEVGYHYEFNVDTLKNFR